MKMLSAAVLLTFVSCIAASAAPPTAKITKATLRSQDELSVQMSFTSMSNTVKKPLMVVYLLAERDDGSIGHATFFNIDLADKAFVDQLGAYGKLMNLAGTPSGSAPNFYVEWEKLLSDASRGTVPVDKKSLANLSLSGKIRGHFGGIKKVLGTRAELWFDGQVIAKFEQVDRTATKSKIPVDWYVYAKHPEQFLYTMISTPAGQSSDFVNIQGKLQQLKEQKEAK